MQFGRFFAIAFLCLSLLFPSAAHQTSPPATQSPQVDPQALIILSKMLATTGWAAVSLPADALATGTVTLNHGETQDTVGVTLKVKGYSEARTELQDPVSPATTIINGEQASFSNSGGTRAIPVHSALSTPPAAMLLFCKLLNTSDPNLAIGFIGTETISGQSASRIQIDRIPFPDEPFAELRRRADHLTIWISTTTFVPLQIQYPRISTGNSTALFPSTWVYSDYRKVNGIAVPFHQDEYAGNQLIHSLQLNTVRFNAGLSDSEFAIAETAQ